LFGALKRKFWSHARENYAIGVPLLMTNCKIHDDALKSTREVCWPMSEFTGGLLANDGVSIYIVIGS
jgi:hypothetical protein